MDSMRHLSTSLPPANRRNNDSTTDILSDFRAAALSVTNLYKTAATSQKRSRAAGYQEALDDLLAFLDRENLGLMDGEGWKVRQWATERLDGDVSAPRQGTDTASNMADDEDDGSTAKDEDKEDERCSSPEIQRKPTHLAVSNSELTEDETAQHRRVVSEPPQLPAQELPQQPVPVQSEFTFQSSHAYPTNHEREGMDVDAIQSTNNSQAPSTADTVRIIPRTRANKHSNHNRRADNSRMPTINFNLGSAAGSKRKMPYPDFFDISGFNDGGDRRDGGGNGRGGKRGRHT